MQSEECSLLLSAVRGSLDRLYVFLDYDGTLAEIVLDPMRAFVSERTKEALKSVSSRFPVAIVTGRSTAKIRNFLDPIWRSMVLAGSHGLDISFSEETRVLVGEEFAESLGRVKQRGLDAIATGELPKDARIEDNGLSVTFHYRNVRSPSEISRVERFVAETVEPAFPELKKVPGKCILEMRPKIDWHKGKAVEFILNKSQSHTIPLYIGDDVTDEDAFAVVNTLGGFSVRVGQPTNNSLAKFSLSSPAQVTEFLELLARPATIDQPLL